jgi:exodeoxyribonuclease V alpha subunit
MGQYTLFEIRNLFERDFFSNLDYYFAESMGKAYNEKNPVVLMSCALISKALSEGHICIDIKQLSEIVISVSAVCDENVKFPGFKTWSEALKNSLMVSKASLTGCYNTKKNSALREENRFNHSHKHRFPNVKYISPAQESGKSKSCDILSTPLVLDSSHRLYLAKYFDFQTRLIFNIAKRVSLQSLSLSETKIDVMLATILKGSGSHIARQKSAVKNALFNHLTIISGGPGTGKTFLISIIKKIVLSYAVQLESEVPKIICTAPTGKAASKMDKGSTIHSILKPLKHTPGFYYNKNNMLRADVVIIDEASMIDISLLTRLLEAVPMTARVIILGDKHQLSPIQAGSVFSDICKTEKLFPNIFFLEYNFRSKGKTGIENLSKAINKKDNKRLESILTLKKYPDVVFEPLTLEGMDAKFVKNTITDGFKSFINTDIVEAALKEIDSFKILCVHNSGEYGTLQINNVCEKILRFNHNFAIDKKPFKKIIMVNTNDYKKGLFNGDTGICFDLKDNGEDRGGGKAFFKDFDNNIKQYQTSNLPGSDTAFAITIHKSQGSEFNTVLIILPDRISPVVTRQLLYTGVTRAKNKVILIGDLELIKKAIQFSVKRNSGLTQYLDRLLHNSDPL